MAYATITISLGLSIFLAMPALAAPVENIAQLPQLQSSEAQPEEDFRRPPESILENSLAGREKQYLNRSIEGFIEQVAAASEAEKEARAAIRLEPTSAEAHLDLADALKALRREQEAGAAYQRAIQLDPESENAYIALGTFFIDQGFWYNAVEVYEAMVEALPESAIAHVQLAYGLERASIDGKDRDDAIEAAYRKAISLDPEQVDTYLRLGTHLSNLEKVFWGVESADTEQLEKAEVVLKEAIRLNPESLEAYRLLSFTTMLLGGSAEAVEAIYQAAFEQMPESLELHYMFGNYLSIWKRQPEEAEAFYKESIERGLTDEFMYAELGKSLANQDKNVEAEAAYREALLLSTEGYAYSRLSEFLADVVNQPEKNILLLEQATRQFPFEGVFYNELGDRLQDAGRINEAIAVYLTALPLTDSADSVKDIAELLVEQQRYAEALDLYERFEFTFRNDLEGVDHTSVKPWQAALRGLGRIAEADSLISDLYYDFAAYREIIYGEVTTLSPKTGAFHSKLGEALIFQGKAAKAEVAYQNALGLDYNPFQSNLQLGKALFDQGKFDSAEAAYEAALALYQPDFIYLNFSRDEFNLYRYTGDLYEATGRIALAIEFYKKALEVSSSNEELAEKVARLQEAVNN